MIRAALKETDSLLLSWKYILSFGTPCVYILVHSCYFQSHSPGPRQQGRGWPVLQRDGPRHGDQKRLRRGGLPPAMQRHGGGIAGRRPAHGALSHAPQ